MEKMDERVYGEFDKSPQSFRYELTDELVRVEVAVGLLGPSCKWDW